LVKVWDKRWSSCWKLFKLLAILTILKLLLCLRWKNWKPCLSWSKNVHYAYVSPENFFWLCMLMLVGKNVFDLPPPPPRRQHFREKFVPLGQNPRKCWSKHDDTPHPPLETLRF
jgi:hypothetical protein